MLFFLFGSRLGDQQCRDLLVRVLVDGPAVDHQDSFGSLITVILRLTGGFLCGNNKHVMALWAFGALTSVLFGNTQLNTTVFAFACQHISLNNEHLSTSPPGPEQLPYFGWRSDHKHKYGKNSNNYRRYYEYQKIGLRINYSFNVMNYK